ncbi:MAG: transcriptional repressor NrdR [Planctomycetota bacterium]|nr:MAG: transcriptional repressor NrdR [Planctomycetota bacterium]
MRCPFCRADNDKVIDSRAGDDGTTIRRRRECAACRRRFTTYERVERQPLSVVKKGGVREPFDRDKIRRGLAKACWKRPVTEGDIEGLVSTLEAELYDTYESEVPSQALGERVMAHLHVLDQVAYVRFASVYREFQDVNDFVDELKPILAASQVAAGATNGVVEAGVGAVGLRGPAPIFRGRDQRPMPRE